MPMRTLLAHLCRRLRREDGFTMILAMGVLVDRLSVDESAARDEFGQRFADFASDDQRSLVRHAFVS